MAHRPFHLLLVEDNAAHAKLAAMAIANAPTPASVDRVPDGEQALAYLAGRAPFEDRLRPDLILLDLRAPKVNGIELLKVVKSDAGLRSIPVVVLSSAVSPADAQNAYHHHANSFLTKPLDYEEYQRMMSDLLRYWATWNQPV